MQQSFIDASADATLNTISEIWHFTECAHPVQICLRVLGEVKVDHNIDSLDVNPTSEEICTSR